MSKPGKRSHYDSRKHLGIVSQWQFVIRHFLERGEPRSVNKCLLRIWSGRKRILGIILIPGLAICEMSAKSWPHREQILDNCRHSIMVERSEAHCGLTVAVLKTKAIDLVKISSPLVFWMHYLVSNWCFDIFRIQDMRPRTSLYVLIAIAGVYLDTASNIVENTAIANHES